MASAAPPHLRPRSRGGSVPYRLILPVVAAIAAILGYPLYSLVRLSLQHYGLFELIRHHGHLGRAHNFSSVLHDQVFWHTLLRTVVFTVVNVGLTIVLGTLIALLLVRVSGWVRILLTVGLVLVWAMPAVVAVQVWYWMTNFQNGVVNYVLTRARTSATSSSTTGTRRPSRSSALVDALVVWGALPFVAITRLRGARAGAARAGRGGRDRRRRARGGSSAT